MKVYALVSGGLPMMALFKQIDLANLDTLCIDADAYFTEHEINRLTALMRMIKPTEQIVFTPVAYKEGSGTLSRFSIESPARMFSRWQIYPTTMISMDVPTSMEPGELTVRNYVVSCNKSFYPTVSIEPTYEDAVACAAYFVEQNHEATGEESCSVFIAELKHDLKIKQF